MLLSSLEARVEDSGVAITRGSTEAYRSLAGTVPWQSMRTINQRAAERLRGHLYLRLYRLIYYILS
jgi:hypothetical protein